MLRRIQSCLIALLTACAASMAQAQSDDFYKGKTITIAIGAPPGGIYDLFGRLFSRHLPNFIAGAPATVVQNMPGAAGIRVSNYLYNAAPRDGTFLAVALNNLPLNAFLAPNEVKYRTEKFNWIGRGDAPAHILFTWAATGLRTLDDARKRDVLTAVTAPGSATEMYPSLANAFAGTRFKLIPGYEGSGGVNLALERGEVEAVGANSWVNISVTKPEWVREKKVQPLFQMKMERGDELPDVPTLRELIAGVEAKQTVELLARTEEVGFYLIAPPEVPAGRVDILRRAFTAMVASPAYREEAARLNFGVHPMNGEDLQKHAEIISATPAEIVARFKQAINSK